MKPYAERSHEKMKEVLMNAEGKGPDIHYYMIRGGSDKKNITVWEPGTIDGEFIKSYGHYHVGDLTETYTVLAGEGIVILQTRRIGADGNPIDDELETFKAVKAKVGDSVFIPSGAGHLMINTGNTWLVTSDDSPVNFEEKDPVSLPGHADYEPFRKLHGAGYYFVKDSSTHTGFKLVPNPHYKNLPLAEIS